MEQTDLLIGQTKRRSRKPEKGKEKIKNTDNSGSNSCASGSLKKVPESIVDTTDSIPSSIILDSNTDSVNSKIHIQESEEIRLTDSGNKMPSPVTTKYLGELSHCDRKRKHSTKDHRHHRRSHHHRHHHNDYDKYSKKKSKTDENVQNLSIITSTNVLPTTNDIINNNNNNNDADVIGVSDCNSSSGMSGSKNRTVNNKNQKKQDKKKSEKVNDTDHSVADAMLMVPVSKIKRNPSPSDNTPSSHDQAKKQKLYPKEVPEMTGDETTSVISRQDHTMSVRKNKDVSVGETSIAPATSTTTITEKQCSINEHKTRPASKKRGAHRNELSNKKSDSNITSSPIVDTTQSDKNHLTTPTKAAKKMSSNLYMKSSHSHSISKRKERSSNSPTNLEGILRCLQRDEKIVLLKKLPCFDRTDKALEAKLKSSSITIRLPIKDLKTEKRTSTMSTTTVTTSAITTTITPTLAETRHSSHCKKKSTHDNNSSSKHGHRHSHGRLYSNNSHSDHLSHENAKATVEHNTSEITTAFGQSELNKGGSVVELNNENNRSEEGVTLPVITTGLESAPTSTLSMSIVNNKCVSNKQSTINACENISGSSRECYGSKKKSRHNN